MATSPTATIHSSTGDRTWSVKSRSGLGGDDTTVGIETHTGDTT
jgi:hypothetical protein